jgi:hypothetical protein
MTATGRTKVHIDKLKANREAVERGDAQLYVDKTKSGRSRILIEKRRRLFTKFGLKKREFVAQAREVMALGRAVFFTELIDDPKFLTDFAIALKTGAKALDNDCMIIVANFLKQEQHEHHHVHEFVRSLGAETEDEARRIIGESKSLEGITDHESFERLLSWGEMYLNQNPDKREQAVRRFGGVILREAERV